MNTDCQKVKADRICAHYLFYRNQKEDQETSVGLRQTEESSDSEIEDVVAELKSLSDSDTESPGGTYNVEVIGMLVGNFFGKP